jgi:hypothetical protein
LGPPFLPRWSGLFAGKIVAWITLGIQLVAGKLSANLVPLEALCEGTKTACEVIDRFEDA